MKKLSITKEAFEKSKYFKNKYGTLKYVSESGNLFKTSKGKILKFKESTDGYEGRDWRSTSFRGPLPYQMDLINHQIKEGGGVVIKRTNKVGDLWTIQTSPEDPLDTTKIYQNIKGLEKAMKYAKDHHWKVLRTIPKDAGAYKESTKKFGRKFNESDIDISEDPAYRCPYCGGRNTEFNDCEDVEDWSDGVFDGATFNATWHCMDCLKIYDVQFTMGVTKVAPSGEL